MKKKKIHIVHQIYIHETESWENISEDAYKLMYEQYQWFDFVKTITKGNDRITYQTINRKQTPLLRRREIITWQKD